MGKKKVAARHFEREHRRKRNWYLVCSYNLERDQKDLGKALPAFFSINDLLGGRGWWLVKGGLSAPFLFSNILQHALFTADLLVLAHPAQINCI